ALPACLVPSFLVSRAPPTVTSTLSLHDALPIFARSATSSRHTKTTDRRFATSRTTARTRATTAAATSSTGSPAASPPSSGSPSRSEEHTSELQSRENLVCRLLLEKKEQAGR